jgi:hypothetical protein
METGLNFAWILLSVGLVRLWMRHAPRRSVGRGVQIAALAMLILILFPVISVTDDLQDVQNFAESDAYLRRVQAATNPHSIVPVADLLPANGLAELVFGFQRMAAPFQFLAPTVENPALAAIENRPPPAA